MMVPLRWQPFVQLILARLREFYREPEVIFWVYGFPLILAVGLGIAFSSKEPEPPAVDIQRGDNQERIDRVYKVLTDGKLPIEVKSREECLRRLTTGKT